MTLAFFDDSEARRIRRAVRKVESGALNRRPPRANTKTPQGVQPYVLRCTSSTPDGNGFYPAQVTFYDPSALAYNDVGDQVFLLPANGEALTSGTRYGARPIGAYSTNLAFQVLGQGGGVTGASSFVGTSLWHSARNISVSNNSVTTISWVSGDVQYDPSSLWSSGSPTQLSLTTGYWLVIAYGGWAFNASGQRALYTIANAGLTFTGFFAGDDRSSVPAANSDGIVKQEASSIVNVSVAGTISVQVYQDSGGALLWNGGLTTVKLSN